MKFEYENVWGKERKWLKGPENLFNVGKVQDIEVRNRERLCSVLGGNFKGPDILCKIEDREIFETEGCWNRESPLYNTIKDNIGALMQISKFVDLFTCT